MSTVIKVENVSKQYRLGEIGTGTISHDLNRWWHKVRGKEDPYLKIGEANDRTAKGMSDYVWALQNINFEVQQGEVLGIIGRNGAGKSTLLKILSKTTTPTTGSIKVKGRIASLLEVGTGFHPELSGRDNIFLNGAILGMTKQEIKRKFDEIVDFSGVERYIDTPVKRYSSGMYVRLAFAVAANLEPEILIVDEVLAVGDLEFQKKALGKMKDVSEKGGRTVLFVSHSMSAIKNLCSTAIVLKNGEIINKGTSEEMIGYYMQNFISFNSSHEIILTKTNRPYDMDLRMQYSKISFYSANENNHYACNERISIKLDLISKVKIDSFRISFGINKMDETCVGVYFSDQKFNIEANTEKSIILHLENHQLAKGQYYFDFAVGIGNEVTGIKDFDIVIKTLFFEIAYKDIDHSEMISLWSTNWGSTNFQHVQINEI